MTYTTKQLDVAPAEIWAFYEPDIATDNCGADIIAHDSVHHGGQRYVRGDIYDGAGAELIAARRKLESVQGLVDALNELMDGNHWRIGQKFDPNSGNFSLSTQRAALAAWDATK